MPEIAGVPLHPAVVHFPIAGAAFAAAALAIAAARGPQRGAAFLGGGLLLLLVSLLVFPLAAWSGHVWADSLGQLPHGEWLPPAGAGRGLLRRHAALAFSAGLLLLLAFLAGGRAKARRSSSSLAFVLALAATLALQAAAHAGGTLVHVKGEGPSEARERTR